MKAYSRLIIAAAALTLGLGTASAQSSTTNDFFNENGEIPTNLPTAYDMKDLTPIEFVNPRADDIYWQKVVYRVPLHIGFIVFRNNTQNHALLLHFPNNSLQILIRKATMFLRKHDRCMVRLSRKTAPQSIIQIK